MIDLSSAVTNSRAESAGGAIENLSARAKAAADSGNLTESLEFLAEAISLQPRDASLINQRGEILHDSGRVAEALLEYERAIGLVPTFARAYANHAAALRQLGRHEEALDSCARALEMVPEALDARHTRALALFELERFDEALEAFDAVIAQAPGLALPYCNRGSTLQMLGQYDAAMASFERAIALEPRHDDAHFRRGLCSLLLGRFAEGWGQFDRRRYLPGGPDANRLLERTHWRGEPIEGKTLLILCEQGFGDTIQFCRYASLAAARGARVVLEVPPQLLTLVQSLEGVAQLVVRGQELPAFDCVCTMVSLPLAFGTTLDTIPTEVPYLSAEPVRVHLWGERLGPRRRPRVGVVWSGGFRPDDPRHWPVNRRRNIPLAKLAPLNHPGVDFISLQVGTEAESELATAQAQGWDGPPLVNVAPLLRDFADTAALIEHLDLVITVDTSIAHLAGALGIPVWIMNRWDTCWRWLLERTDSPWYPTVTLYRQETPGDWDGVVRRVRSDLDRFVAQSV